MNNNFFINKIQIKNKIRKIKKIKKIFETAIFIISLLNSNFLFDINVI